MTTAFIAIQDFTRYQSQIAPDFIKALHHSGLIHCRIEEEVFMIDPDELPQIEQYARLHYDLDINLEGIEAIAHLLHRIEDMQQEMQRLQAFLAFHNGR